MRKSIQLRKWLRSSGIWFPRSSEERFTAETAEAAEILEDFLGELSVRGGEMVLE
jgi:hypothetical protein